ncbi:hypothetical protein BP00DRAFT_259898 [Aspergillus indologenus CBS 114.80]|uniref:Secreted protein n=1 Tax=Aspergillus indologenus CBS 114.80 TaxID=1450541 RepID=A0A2V5HVF2_9EURO|nr:hypothetical protein BP00DRAFT_259898 [Aspergillus indologenus CBS 114.80]
MRHATCPWSRSRPVFRILLLLLLRSRLRVQLVPPGHDRPLCYQPNGAAGFEQAALRDPGSTDATVANSHPLSFGWIRTVGRPTRRAVTADVIWKLGSTREVLLNWTLFVVQRTCSP